MYHNKHRNLDMLSMVWPPDVQSKQKHRVAQINSYKFQMVGSTYTKRNGNICFNQVIVYIHSSQDIVMFDKSTKIIEWSKQKEMPLLNYAARAIPLLAEEP